MPCSASPVRFCSVSIALVILLIDRPARSAVNSSAASAPGSMSRRSATLPKRSSSSAISEIPPTAARPAKPAANTPTSALIRPATTFSERPMRVLSRSIALAVLRDSPRMRS